jgi:cytochrome c-type biogenesis protein CcmH/NrfG
VPANALMGLVAAAWVVARPPLRTRLEDAALAGAVPAPARDRSLERGPLWGPPGEEPSAGFADPVAEPRRRRPLPWVPAGAAALVLALALTAGWAAFQPVRSVHAGDAAIERLEQGAPEPAAAIAEIAHDRNPLSPEPLWELAFIEQQRGRLASAGDALEEAVRIQPGSAETWRRLGRFQLSTLHRPADAIKSFRAAYFLDPRNPQSTSDFLEARRAAGEPAVAP